MGIRNLFDPESGMEKIRIRDKHPGTATLTLSVYKDAVKVAGTVQVQKGTVLGKFTW